MCKSLWPLFLTCRLTRNLFSFPDLNSMAAVFTQATVQDVWWVYEAAAAIRRARCPAYFIAPLTLSNVDPANISVFYAVVSLPVHIKSEYKQAWQRLTDRNKPLKLHLFKERTDGELAAKWDCRLVEHPEAETELGNNHPIEKHEVVLCVGRSGEKAKGEPNFVVKTFGGRSVANRAGKDQ